MRSTWKFWTTGAAALIPILANGAVTGDIDYRQGETTLQGFVAYPKRAAAEKSPAVIIVHEWDGLGDYAKRRARMLADLGYVAFDADIYGKGVRAKDTDEAARLAKKYKDDRALTRKRIRAAFDYVSSLPNVDPQRIAVMGYCFGGMVALELARSGAPVAGTVTFHGALNSPSPADAKNIHGKVLVLHGADDPAVPPAEVAAFKREMTDASVDYQFVAYPGAVHGFTNPKNTPRPGSPVAWNPQADKESWEEMRKFFAGLFRK